MKAEFSSRALRDLQEILEYIAKDNPHAAAKLIDRLEKTCRGLVQTPAIGTMRDELAPGLRAFTQGRYVIYFVPQTESILRIVRVLHGARDVKPTDFKPSL